MNRGLLSIRGVDRSRGRLDVSRSGRPTTPGVDEAAVALSFRQPGPNRDRAIGDAGVGLSVPGRRGALRRTGRSGPRNGPGRGRRTHPPRRGRAGLSKRTEARRDSDCAAADLELLHRRGGRLLTPDDDEWPHLAFSAFAGPGTAETAGLCTAGARVVGPLRLDEVAERAAAIVGTRMPTAYGEHVASDPVSRAGQHDVAVVSGGACGVDGRRTGRAGRRRLSRSRSQPGVDVYYPAGHSTLLHRIAANGVLVSEYPPGVRPARYRFLTRNRLVAALAGATVVVEAAFAAVRRAPRHGRGHSAGWCVRCPAP